MTIKKRLYKDLSGKVFHRWTVKNFDCTNRRNAAWWICQCICGVIRSVGGASLVSGQSKSCGCLHSDNVKNNIGRGYKHGLSDSPIYHTWEQMLARCKNKKHQCYKDYGARGITVCEKWLKFEGFYEDMATTWFPKASIERKEVNGNYTFENCMWIPKENQQFNKRDTIYINVGGNKTRLKEACLAAGVVYTTALYRLKSGWPEELILSKKNWVYK